MLCTKYFVYTYNYLTLHKAITYARKEWGIENTYFIYTTLTADPPTGFLNGNYNKYIINPHQYRHKSSNIFISIIDSLIADKKASKEMARYIDKNVKNKKEEINLVVFRDTAVRESILIDIVKRKYIHAHIIMIEEGLSVYAQNTAEPLSLGYYIKSYLYRLLGVPVISLRHNRQHGCNPLTDTIICRCPEILKEKYPNKSSHIQQETDLFCKEYSQFFVSSVLNIHINPCDYDYVFLTQPDFPRGNDSLNTKYDLFLKKLFEILSKHGNVLIKPHPRDKWNYSEYVNDRIKICPKELTKCPYECFYSLYGAPQSITLYSSAASNTAISKPTIFLYDFFPEVVNSDLFADTFIRTNNIIRCKTYEEIEKAIE